MIQAAQVALFKFSQGAIMKFFVLTVDDCRPYYVTTHRVSDTLVFTAVVSGSDNLAVGMTNYFSAEGTAVDPSSYTLCGTVTGITATAGFVVTVNCLSSTQPFRYVIVQSLDASPGNLCIAEVAVYCTSQYAITFLLLQLLVVTWLHLTNDIVLYLAQSCRWEKTHFDIRTVYTQDDSNVISIHIYAGWFSPPSCR